MFLLLYYIIVKKLKFYNIVSVFYFSDSCLNESQNYILEIYTTECFKGKSDLILDVSFVEFSQQQKIY